VCLFIGILYAHSASVFNKFEKDFHGIKIEDDTLKTYRQIRKLIEEQKKEHEKKQQLSSLKKITTRIADLSKPSEMFENIPEVDSIPGFTKKDEFLILSVYK